VAVEFNALVADAKPQTVVVFNGLQFPEATARWIAQQHGIRVITHEVGFQPFSAFFSEGQVTAYPIDIDDDFELSPMQQARIDEHLSRRFQGEFTMAGITFWPEMKGLNEYFLKRAENFEQIVPIFTNVIFDTSQVHANTVFTDMFEWLDLLLEMMRKYSKTLFVIRAHPDEMREGKKSRESVQEWVKANGVEQLPNVIFVASDEPLSSYDLIRRSKFVVVYNSSIGLEAALLGAPVLCGGQARYTYYPTVFFPQMPEDYRKMVEQFLTAETIEIPPEFQRNARRVLYHQFYRSSLLFDDYLEAHPTPGYVQLRRFSWRDLLPENSPTMQVLVGGITEDAELLMLDKS
jgi:capsule polysaccharide modification protein KpsS